MPINRTMRNAGRAVKTVLTRHFSVCSPRLLWLEDIDLCNSRCQHCNIWRMKSSGKMLSVGEVERLCSNPLLKHVRVVLNSGGESTLRDDLVELLLAEHKALPSATIQLSTNGINGKCVVEVATKLFQHGCRLAVGISLDGVGSEHDEIRGVKGNFASIVSMLPELCKVADVSMGALLSDATIEANLRAKRFAEEHGFPFLFHWLNKSEYYGNQKQDNRASLIVASAVQQLKPSMYRDLWLHSLSHGLKCFDCFALETFLVVKCNGDVVPCLSKWDCSVGNIHKQNIDEIWRSTKADHIRKDIKSCSGCLNHWACTYSLESKWFPLMKWKIQRIFD